MRTKRDSVDGEEGRLGGVDGGGVVVKGKAGKEVGKQDKWLITSPGQSHLSSFQ